MVGEKKDQERESFSVWKNFVVPVVSIALQLLTPLSMLVDISPKWVLTWPEALCVAGTLIATVSVIQLVTRWRRYGNQKSIVVLAIITIAAVAVSAYGTYNVFVRSKGDEPTWKIVYSYRTREKLTSDEETVDGWIRVGVEVKDVGEPYWSAWTTKALVGENVQKLPQWRYQEKETAIFGEPYQEGWILDETYSLEPVVGEWSIDYPEEKPGRTVEEKWQYLWYQDYEITSYETEYYGWTTEPSYCIEEMGYRILNTTSSQRWYYYTYICGNCGNHEPFAGDVCEVCGEVVPFYYAESSQTLSYAEAVCVGEVKGIPAFWIDGEKLFAVTDPNSVAYNPPTTFFLYQVEHMSTTRFRGESSEWSDDYPNGSNITIESRKVYRSVDPQYMHYRWSNPSKWENKSIEENEDRKVESRIIYRQLIQPQQTIYYFERWGEWSEWTEEEPIEQEGQQIRKKVVSV